MSFTRYKRLTLPKLLPIVGWTLCVIFGFILFCNLVIIVKGTLHPDRPPSVFGTTPMAVLSGSMSGTQKGHIEVGDLVFIGKTKPEKLKVGDVIAFMQGSIVVTHRIVETQLAEGGTIQWITKGDANNAPDREPVPQQDLVGVYKGRIPKLGDFALFLQKPLGMLLFIGIPLLAFAVYDIVRRQSAAQKAACAQSDKESRLQAELDRLRKQTAEEDEQLTMDLLPIFDQDQPSADQLTLDKLPTADQSDKSTDQSSADTADHR